MEMKTAVVLRFSAMGDVILLLPSLWQVLAENPDIEIIVVSKSEFSSFFVEHPRLHFRGVSLTDSYRGFTGTLRLAAFVVSLRPTLLIDQHHSLRSVICSWYAALHGISTHTIRKEKWKKVKMTRRFWKRKTFVKPMIERYADTWRRAGWLAERPLDVRNVYIPVVKETVTQTHSKKNGEKWIGIAPYSQHRGKNWPTVYFAELIQKLLESDTELSIFLVGSKKDEEQWRKWQPTSARVFSLAACSFDVQFAYFNQFDVLVCLDSSNLHLANMMQVPTVSIWGATHPDLGYAPFSVVSNRIVQDDLLGCRPCSTYGKTSCYRGDFACLIGIKPEQVLQEISQMI